MDSQDHSPPDVSILSNIHCTSHTHLKHKIYKDLFPTDLNVCEAICDSLENHNVNNELDLFPTDLKVCKAISV